MEKIAMVPGNITNIPFHALKKYFQLKIALYDPSYQDARFLLLVFNPRDMKHKYKLDCIYNNVGSPCMGMEKEKMNSSKRGKRDVTLSM